MSGSSSTYVDNGTLMLTVPEGTVCVKVTADAVVNSTGEIFYHFESKGYYCAGTWGLRYVDPHYYHWANINTTDVPNNRLNIKFESVPPGVITGNDTFSIWGGTADEHRYCPELVDISTSPWEVEYQGLKYDFAFPFLEDSSGISEWSYSETDGEYKLYFGARGEDFPLNPPTVKCHFKKTVEYIYVSSGGDVGAGTVSITPSPAGSNAYEWGTTVTLTATPSPHARFVRWEWNGGSGSAGDKHGISGNTSPTVSFETLPKYLHYGEDGHLIGSNVVSRYVAIFEWIKYSVDIVAEPASASTSPFPIHTTVREGESYSVDANPDDLCDYEFDQWSDGVKDSSRSWDYVSEDIYLIAYFKRKTYSLSVDIDDPTKATYTVSPQGPYHKGDTATVVVAATCCWGIIEICGRPVDPISRSESCSVTFDCEDKMVSAKVRKRGTVGYDLVYDPSSGDLIYKCDGKLIYGQIEGYGTGDTSRGSKDGIGIEINVDDQDCGCKRK